MAPQDHPLFELSLDCTKVLDTSGGLLAMNRNGQCLMEVDDFGPLHGQGWASMWPEEAQERIRDAVRRAACGDSVRLTAFCPTAKGTPKWWDVFVAPMTDDHGRVTALLAVSRDITPHLQSQRALADSEAKFRTIANAMPQMVWSTRADGFHDYYNDPWYAFTGVPHGSTDGEGWSGMFHPEDQARAWERWRHSLATGETYEIEYRLRHRSGEYRWVLGRALPIRDERGDIVRWMGTCTDIHHQKTTESLLEDARMRLQATLEAAEVGTWNLDLRAERVHADANFARLYGLGHANPGGLPSSAYFEVIHPEDVPRARERLEHALRTGEPYRDEYRVRDGDGWRHILARGQVKFDAQGRPAWLPGLAMDVTEAKRTEHSLREMDRRKDEFLAMLAHELRNPLAPIASASALLPMVAADEQRVRRIAEVVGRQAGHMRGLIDDLLDVSRVTRGLITLQEEALDLRGVLAEALEQTRPLLEYRHHRVEMAPAAGLRVMGDRKRLVQVFANLLTNAAKYTPGPGLIEVQARRADDRVLVTVRDNGIGMTPELLSRAFELFAQGERTPDRGQGGLGLGLAIVRRVVELHAGTVVARSSGPGQGSEFEVALPLLQAATDPHRVEGDSDLSVVQDASTRVLVVDDNHDAAEVLSMLLHELGYEVFVEENGQQALAAARAVQPHICLLDIGLPDIDGVELGRRIRALPGLQQVMLAAVTGYGQPRDIEDTRAAGFHRHFVKPVEAQALVDWLGALRRQQGQAASV